MSLFKRVLLTLCCILPLSEGHAKTIDLYDKPKDGKIISKLDSESGVIKIFIPKDGTWIKVADPRDGNVGWIKSADLQDMTTQMNLTRSSGSQKQYRVIQSSYPSARIYQLMQQQMDEMERVMHDFNSGWFGFPYGMNTSAMVPVFILPVQDVQSQSNRK